MVEAGADGITAVNSLGPGLILDIETGRPILAHGTGGVSGPPLRPIAVRCVRDIYRAVDVPVVGVGGIMNAADALEFLIAGASAVQVGTANFVNPAATVEIIDGIANYLLGAGMRSVREIIGSLEA